MGIFAQKSRWVWWIDGMDGVLRVSLIFFISRYIKHYPNIILKYIRICRLSSGLWYVRVGTYFYQNDTIKRYLVFLKKYLVFKKRLFLPIFNVFWPPKKVSFWTPFGSPKNSLFYQNDTLNDTLKRYLFQSMIPEKGTFLR